MIERRAAEAAAFLVLFFVSTAAADDPGHGERLFQRCYGCHSVNPAERDLPGPNLHGVVGRAAGADRAFEYSPALRVRAAEGLIWAEAQLDKFLADPDAMIPRTAMNFAGIMSAADRRDLIAYLRQSGEE
jgi:cytochrome c